MKCKGLMASATLLIFVQIAAYFSPQWASVPMLRWPLLAGLLWNVVLASRQKRDRQGPPSWSWLSLLLWINCLGNLVLAIFLTGINQSERIPGDLPDFPTVIWFVSRTAKQQLYLVVLTSGVVASLAPRIENCMRKHLRHTAREHE